MAENTPHRRTNSLDTRSSIRDPDNFVFKAPARTRRDTESRSAPPPAEAPVTWMSLPRKGQLGILFISRLVDFLQVASLQSYLFYQLKSFDTTLSDGAISSQAGILQGCFTGAQVATAMLWGNVADNPSGGRKLVLLVGLGGTAISCLGYGFATSFYQAAVFRIIAGCINGTVGIIRTMVAEITVEKKYQSRAFLILPMSFNVAGIIGPIVGGILASPAMTLPEIFGPGALFGFQWIQDYPFALPSIVNALLLATATAFVFFGLEETLEARKGRFDYGLYLAKKFRLGWGIDGRSSSEYSLLPQDISMPASSSSKPEAEKVDERPKNILPFRRVFTPNVLLTMVTIALFDFQIGAFTNVWSLFLSTPRNVPADVEKTPTPIRAVLAGMSGGLGMPASTVGLATSILGVLGMGLQLFLYPPVHARLGTLRSFRLFLLLFPVAYFMAPYLSALPSSTEAPEPADGPFIWIGITLVLLFQVMARTFTLPATIILLNNCSPHPSVLGTVHGLGQSTSAAFRTIGPIAGGIWYAMGIQMGLIQFAWWATAAISVFGCMSAVWVYEGSGHEILLDGEEGNAAIELGAIKNLKRT